MTSMIRSTRAAWLLGVILTVRRLRLSFSASLDSPLIAPEVMRRSLLGHPLTAQLVIDDIDIKGFGSKLVFECRLPDVPNERAYYVRTVWIEDDGDDRLITAYPR